jgi:hypothetical protein
MKKYFTILFLFILSISVTAQNKTNVSIGAAPFSNVNKMQNTLPLFNVTNANTRGFAYSTAGLTSSTLFKFFAGTPSVITVVGSPQPNFFGGGDFANPTGIWNFYVIEQVAPPFNIYQVDTSTGNVTLIGGISGLTSGHSPLLFEWNTVQNKFYVYSASSSLSSGQLYSMDWGTRVLTPIGGPNTICPGLIAGGVTASGTAIVGVDVVSDNFYRLNLSTGTAMLIGPSGLTVNYGQDAGFDRSDWTLYWAACNGTSSQLRIIDTAIGISTLIGAFPYNQVLAIGFTAIPCNGPQITHTPLANTENLNGPYLLTLQISSCNVPIVSAKIKWSRNNTILTDSVTMTNSGGNNWTGSIPGNGTVATYRYDIKSVDSLGRVGWAPGPPPAVYTFIATNSDTTKPVITHTPIENTPLYNWPPTVNCTATDPFGIDSVWVIWWKNNNPRTRFNLFHISGNNWAGVFQAGGVSNGDVIHYRIIARDASTAHNIDSTVQFNFNIINTATVCIGTGTIPMGSSSGPFNTYWYGNRTQMLYTASEIMANGYYGQGISRIAFNVSSVGGQTMNGFQINMQQTTMTTLSGFTTSGWTNVYSGTYTVQGTGWQCINLQNTFNYYGSQNLLIEVCFGNTSYTTATTVLGTTMSGMEYSEYHDILTACTTFLAPTAQTARANLCINCVISETNSNLLNIPEKYFLSQNFPNPFNPITRINFDIAKKGFVS